jgi:hypothetical protein
MQEAELRHPSQFANRAQEIVTFGGIPGAEDVQAEDSPVEWHQPVPPMLS